MTPLVGGGMSTGGPKAKPGRALARMWRDARTGEFARHEAAEKDEVDTYGGLGKAGKEVGVVVGCPFRYSSLFVSAEKNSSQRYRGRCARLLCQYSRAPCGRSK